MPALPQDLTIRHPATDDARRTLDLMARCEISEYGESDSDLEDLLYNWSQIDLSRDAWLAFTPEGDLVGYGAVIPHWSRLRYDFYADPSWEGEGLGAAMLARCEARGGSIAEAREEAGELLATTYIAHVNQRDREVVERAGFRLVKYHFQMRIQMDGPPPEPQWPDGVSARRTVPEQDDRAIYDLIQSAFARSGRTPPSFEDWRGFMMRPDIFKADLWFLGVAAEGIVGACLCFEYPEEGWVRQLGVAREWRRRGLGTALLHHAFGEFWKRGFDRVGLAVDADNADAYRFYETVGMKRVRQYDEYEKPIYPSELGIPVV